MLKIKLHWQILGAITLAIVSGGLVSLYGDGGVLFGLPLDTAFNFIGTLFLNALKMIIVPLITSSIIVGVAGIGSSGNLGRLGGKTLFFYASTTLMAIVLGLIVINLVSPGLSSEGTPVAVNLDLQADAEALSSLVGDKGVGDVVEVFLRMIPPNIVAAAANGEMLGLIVFAILFGYFMTRLSHEHSSPLYQFWDGLFKVMMHMTEWVMKFAPIGVFGLIAGVIAGLQFDRIADLFEVLVIFSASVTAALALHAFITLPLLLKYIAKVRPTALYPAVAPALLTAFSTSSSSATLPITMDCVENNVGVSSKVSSFVLPLGATVNMNGTAMYECMAALFLAQAYGLDLTIGMQFLVVIIALLTSVGVAGVPSSSLVAIAIILSAIGLPMEALGLLLVFDRLLDMARTSVNVLGDTCCATIIARLEDEPTNIAARSD